MILKIFTKGDGPESRDALALGQKLEELGFEIENYDGEQQEATVLMEIYDVYSFPTFLVTQDDGALVEQWKGVVPLESDLRNFLSQ